MKVSDLDFRFKITEPSEFWDGQKNDICIAAYPPPDVRFAVLWLAGAHVYQSSITAALSDATVTLAISRFDLRSRPDMTISALAENFMAYGEPITNPKSALLEFLGEFPPVGREPTEAALRQELYGEEAA